jgi:hypothetical protein
MIVNEEDFDALVEAVNNAQMRLADTYMLSVIAQLIDSVEEIKHKVDSMYEFLTEEDEVDTEEKTEVQAEEVQAEEVKEQKPTAPAKQKKIEKEEKSVEETE